MPHRITGAIERQELFAMRNAICITAATLRRLHESKQLSESEIDRLAVEHAFRLFDRATVRFLSHKGLELLLQL